MRDRQCWQAAAAMMWWQRRDQLRNHGDEAVDSYTQGQRSDNALMKPPIGVISTCEQSWTILHGGATVEMTATARVHILTLFKQIKTQ